MELTPTALPLRTISSPFGHDGFLIEVEEVGRIVSEALALGEQGIRGNIGTSSMR